MVADLCVLGVQFVGRKGVQAVGVESAVLEPPREDLVLHAGHEGLDVAHRARIAARVAHGSVRDGVRVEYEEAVRFLAYDRVDRGVLGDGEPRWLDDLYARARRRG